MNKKIWLVIAAGITAILVVALLGAIFVFPVRTVLANALVGPGGAGTPPWWGAWHTGWGNGSGITLPPQLQGLASIPSGQRFAHFTGAQLSLKDENGKPLTIDVVPGVVTAASPTSLAIAANDGSAQTFTLNDQTVIHRMASSPPAAPGTPAAGIPAAGIPAASPSLQKDTQVVVVTLNHSPTAAAVLAAGPSGFGSPGGWWGRWAAGGK
jgi:hypothetical protein